MEIDSPVEISKKCVRDLPGCFKRCMKSEAMLVEEDCRFCVIIMINVPGCSMSQYNVILNKS